MMLIDAPSALALAAIIFASTQGRDDLNRQMPLQVVDRGDNWLVKGTPYTNLDIESQYIASYIFIIKSSGEVAGLGSDARMILPEAEKKKWSSTLNAAKYAAVFGPRTKFEPRTSQFQRSMMMCNTLYGGLINTPSDAVAYARVLMAASPRYRARTTDTLVAKEQDTVWIISARTPAGPDGEPILTFSRKTGKLLSGDL